MNLPGDPGEPLASRSGNPLEIATGCVLGIVIAIVTCSFFGLAAGVAVRFYLWARG